MAIQREEIIALVRQQLKQYESKVTLDEIGYVLKVGDGVALLQGLENAMMGELLQFPGNLFGMVMNLEHDTVSCVLFGSDTLVKEGDEVRRTGSVMEVPVGEELLGRVVNPLGQPLDEKGPVNSRHTRPVEVIAPHVVERQPVREPLQTGWKSVDAMIPIGRGQRELIIGDRQTGKTVLAIDTIINQKNETDRPICIYVAIGQKQSVVARIVKTLEDNGAMEYTIVVNATASDPAPLQYIAPYAGCSMGEYFLWQGKDVLCVYDDLSKHAQAYRQLSLLLRRPPGREAYPGDVFYLHSRLLERACKLSDKNGGGSLTALPIVETQANDISAYIPTNVISITDGQIYLESSLFYSGIRPAVNIGLSVSRVGGSAQIKAMRKVAGRLRLDLAQFRELASFAQFASDLDKSTRAQLVRGEHMVELLKQGQHSAMSVEDEVMAIYAGTGGFIDDLPLTAVHSFEKELLAFMARRYPEIGADIKKSSALSEETAWRLSEAIQEFKRDFTARLTA
ncbi:MAG: F0F1 ATP synthase subunit alpha [Elusimicrobia bacterium RIFOXYA2_FULL_50_26]|nr:MAG: F0F1 ATP synthase subunit alpha [Elusimicrobia bacterium RIFOXYA2_FULL_50_26]OGS23413.1 MAG: F0F1 ATP synthase subunit alpha [Elusimicrobia bacterium RIFOXYB2_FULL_50_12]